LGKPVFYHSWIACCSALRAIGAQQQQEVTCREQPASQTQRNLGRTAHRSREEARVGQMKSFKEEARDIFVKVPKGFQGNADFF